MGEILLAVLATIQFELMLFAAAGLLLGGADDFVIDMLYLCRRWWRRWAVYSRHPRMTTTTLPQPTIDGRIAVFVPAWQESGVIAAMLRHALTKWGNGNYTLFVGVYPNDRETIDAVASVARDNDRVAMAVNDQPGPTTKADCLNMLWRAMLAKEVHENGCYKAIVLHDAEDVVHQDEIRLFDTMIDRFDMVQLPVLPLVNQNSRWIAGHYCDEFAEAHNKYLTVREALGASVPSAGVGCAFSREALMALAGTGTGTGDGYPFDASSLTEDYETGLRIAQRGGRGIFLRMRDARGDLVCTREYFPETLRDAVRQKARWVIGISLSGWDRLGWHGGPVEYWMRLRDRRALLSAMVLFAVYLSLVLTSLLAVATWMTGQPLIRMSPALSVMLQINGVLMVWRLAVRAIFVERSYGFRQGFLAIPRALVANLVAVLAARRAALLYARSLMGRPLQWDKTTHHFPDLPAET